VDATAELQGVDVSSLSRAERMAFWINIYNILVVRFRLPCRSPAALETPVLHPEHLLCTCSILRRRHTWVYASALLLASMRMRVFSAQSAAAQVHALVVFGPAEGTFARLRWFDSIAYTVGGRRYTSNDMEHGVLRGNRPSPAHPLSLLGLASLAPLTFKAGDARLPQARSPLEVFFWGGPAPHIEWTLGEHCTLCSWLLACQEICSHC
jgi:hypothetical protein